MLETEEVIEKILEERSDLSRTDIVKMMGEKKEKLRGLISDLTAVYLLAAELGVEIGKLKPRIRMSEVITGLNDITLIGRVIFIYPEKQTKSTKLRRILLGDETGKIRTVFWGERTTIAGRLKEGDIVRISHVYVRAGLDGKPEVHVGDKGAVEINPPDVDDKDYPAVETFFKKLNTLRPEDSNVFTAGVLKERLPSKVFSKKGGKGEVARATIEDDTGSVMVCFWDDKVSELENLEVGKWIKIMNARTKRALDGSTEIHINRTTGVNPMNRSPSALPTFTKISELKVGVRSANILARVSAVGTRRFPSLLLDDGSGTIRIYLWDDKARLIDKVKAGDVVLVKSASVRYRQNRLSLSVGRIGSITINPEIPASAMPPQIAEKITKIKDLSIGQRNIAVEAEVVDAPTVREVVTARGETVNVASFRVRDDTGIVRASVWRDLVEQVRDLPIGTRIKMNNLFVRSGLGGKTELGSTMFTTIEIVGRKAERVTPKPMVAPKPFVPLKPKEAPKRQIAEIKEGERATIEGQIKEIASPSYVYAACPKCSLKLRSTDTSFSCPNCGIVKPLYRIVITAVMEDPTGAAKVILASPIADKLLDMSGEEIWKLQEAKRTLPFSKLVGKIISVTCEMTTLDGKKYLVAEHLIES